MYLLAFTSLLFAISKLLYYYVYTQCTVDSVYGQECPNGSTTQLFVGEGSIPLPMIVPACITCDFFSGTGLVNPTDFTWSRNPNSDNTPLTNGSFGGNVLITSDTRTLILIDPAAIVSVNDIIRCDSASNGQHLITIQSFGKLNIN